MYILLKSEFVRQLTVCLLSCGIIISTWMTGQNTVLLLVVEEVEVWFVQPTCEGGAAEKEKVYRMSDGLVSWPETLLESLIDEGEEQIAEEESIKSERSPILHIIYQTG